jgi:hypothetical protein
MVGNGSGHSGVMRRHKEKDETGEKKRGEMGRERKKGREKPIDTFNGVALYDPANWGYQPLAYPSLKFRFQVSFALSIFLKFFRSWFWVDHLQSRYVWEVQTFL